MLPLLNLTSSEFMSPDALKGANRLVPDDLNALHGGFASVLQAEFVPASVLQAPAGEGLPVTGNALPVTLSGNALQLEADLELALEPPLEPPPELPLDELDLSPQVGQSLADIDTDPAWPTMLAEAAPEPGNPVLADAGLQVMMQVPPAPDVTDTADPAIPVSAGDIAGDETVDALQVPLMVPGSNAEDRGSRPQARDRAIDSATVRQQFLARANASIPAHAAAANDNDLNPGSRPIAGIDDATAELLHRPGSRADGPVANRAATELALSSDDSTRAVRDDGLPVPRPVQPAPWQQGTVAPEVVAEAGQRIHADVPAAMSRAPTAPPAQALPPLPTGSQSIDIPVQQSGWDNVLADRVTMMANGRLQNAELRLTPAELGPLRIQLEIDDGVANVSFQSQHPVTREALEQAMPRLRELLAENGLSLGQADVRDDSSQQGNRGALADAAASSAAGAESGEFDETPATRTMQRVSDSLVDTFA